MADLKTKIMQLDPATPVDTDWFPFVKVSDTTQSPQGSTVRGLKSELQGATGNGISSVTLISTVGLVKTYRITFTDATTFDYEVTDGTDGAGAGDMVKTVYDAAGKEDQVITESDYSPAHSLLVQQSGTGSPSSVSVGNNEILGRQTGGGADIEGLSATDVRSILNVADGAIANVVEDTTPQLGGNLDLNGNVIIGLEIGTDVQAYDANNTTASNTQTLTNKTLTDPKINLGSDATGDIYYRNASGELERLPIGTALQSLQVNAGGTALEYITPAGGGTTYPSNIYESSATAGIANTVFTFTHNLGLTQADVQDGRYKTILTGTFFGRGYVMGDTYGDNTIWGSSSSAVSNPANWAEWSATNPTNGEVVRHQANTSKIRLGTNGGNLVDVRMIIQQLY